MKNVVVKVLVLPQTTQMIIWVGHLRCDLTAQTEGPGDTRDVFINLRHLDPDGKYDKDDVI